MLLEDDLQSPTDINTGLLSPVQYQLHLLERQSSYPQWPSGLLAFRPSGLADIVVLSERQKVGGLLRGKLYLTTYNEDSSRLYLDSLDAGVSINDYT